MFRELVTDWRAEWSLCRTPADRFFWVLFTPLWVVAYVLAALTV